MKMHSTGSHLHQQITNHQQAINKSHLLKI